MKGSVKLIVIAIVVLVLMLLVIAGLFFSIQSPPVYNPPTGLPEIVSNVPTSLSQSERPVSVTSKNYSSKKFGLSFTYPTEIKVNENDQEINLSHSIPYKNYGCDMRGDGIQYDNLTDFGIKIQVINKPFTEAVQLDSPYMANEIFVDGGMVIAPGFIDSYKNGVLDGYAIYMGAEGCGQTVYYFEITDNKTLIIKRHQVQEFSGAITEDVRKAVLAVSGVITPEKEKVFFDQILSSIKFTEQN